MRLRGFSGAVARKKEGSASAQLLQRSNGTRSRLCLQRPSPVQRWMLTMGCTCSLEAKRLTERVKKEDNTQRTTKTSQCSATGRASQSFPNADCGSGTPPSGRTRSMDGAGASPQASSYMHRRSHIPISREPSAREPVPNSHYLNHRHQLLGSHHRGHRE